MLPRLLECPDHNPEMVFWCGPPPCTGLLRNIETTPIACELCAYLALLDVHKENHTQHMANKQTEGMSACGKVQAARLPSFVNPHNKDRLVYVSWIIVHLPAKEVFPVFKLLASIAAFLAAGRPCIIE